MNWYETTLIGPRAADDRRIEWATRNHRTRHRKTTVGQRSHHARAKQDHLPCLLDQPQPRLQPLTKWDVSHGYWNPPKRHMPLRSRLTD
jgi:hypothetical protein